jgi:hypothetical protein
MRKVCVRKILFLCICLYSRMRKLIDMGDGDMNAKKIHYDNLWHIVRYCENISDCRCVFLYAEVTSYQVDTCRFFTVIPVFRIR